MLHSIRDIPHSSHTCKNTSVGTRCLRCLLLIRTLGLPPLPCPRHLWAKGTSEPFTGQENPPRFFCRGKKRRTVPPSSYESQRLIASFRGQRTRCVVINTARSSLMKRSVNAERRRTSTKPLHRKNGSNRVHTRLGEGRGLGAASSAMCFSMGAKCLTVRRGVQAPPLWEVEETREIRFSRSHSSS